MDECEEDFPKMDPAVEAAVLADPGLRASLERGIADATAGRVEDLGDFTRFAEGGEIVVHSTDQAVLDATHETFDGTDTTVETHLLE